MTSTIKVDNIQNQCGANIINESSNTITIGASGDTVSLASGASQTGFGRAGSVDWQTSIKTTSFTAVSGEGYFVNTTSGAITVTLPASPSAGAIVAVKDYANTADTNNITIARNGSNIDGGTDDVVMITEGIAVTLVYADATKGWLIVDSGQKSDLIVPAFLAATGGTITTVGDYKIHSFTSPGTFCVSCAGNAGGSNTVQLAVVAGGGAGGRDRGGGGGAGGLVFTPCAGSPVTVQGYPVTIGAGGAAGNPDGNPGSSSTMILTAVGGGKGGILTSPYAGGPGGSGGGGAGGNPSSFGAGGSATQPSQPGNSGTYGFGNAGGNGQDQSPLDEHQSGGGGGAGAGGTTGTPSTSGPGGAGKDVTPIFGTAPQPFYLADTPNTGATSAGIFAGGGGGGGSDRAPAGQAGSGGTGGGGNGGAASQGSSKPGTAGATNSGGGGGGGGNNPIGCGANGGSGIVLIRYKFQ